MTQKTASTAPRSILVSGLELEDQSHRLVEVQICLYKMQRIFRAISMDEITPALARDVSEMAAIAAEYLAEGMAEQAVEFAGDQQSRFSAASAQGEEAEE